jgi:outer membrane protein with beta-barrel domain
MRRYQVLTFLILFCAPATFAQSSDDYPKLEVYGGYSLARTESNLSKASFTSAGGTQTFTNLCSAATGAEIGPNSQQFFCQRRNLNGFDASITYNVSKYVGVKGDLTGHFKTSTYVDKFTPPGVTQTLNNKERIYNFLGGVQLKNNSRDARIKPFAHALAGFARYTNEQQQILDLFPQFNFSIEDRETSFAMKLGGGLDIRAGKRLDIRVFELDYNPVFAGDRRPKSISGPFTNVAFTGRTAHNFTIGVGIVIH